MENLRIFMDFVGKPYGKAMDFLGTWEKPPKSGQVIDQWDQWTEARRGTPFCIEISYTHHM